MTVLREVTKKKKPKKTKSPTKESGSTALISSNSENAAAGVTKTKKKKKKAKTINEEHLSAFLQFHPNAIPNTANDLLTTTQRIEKTFRTLSRHFSFRNVKDATQRADENRYVCSPSLSSVVPTTQPSPVFCSIKNDLDLATPPTLAFSERQLPTRTARPQIPRITPPKVDSKISALSPVTAPARSSSSPRKDGTARDRPSHRPISRSLTVMFLQPFCHQLPQSLSLIHI